MDARFVAVGAADVTLGPGDERDVGALRFVVAETGTLTLEGSVALVDGDGGPRTVRLLRKRGAGYQVASERLSTAAGGFSFDQLPPGQYAVVATLAGFTPAWRSGLEVRDEGQGLTEPVALELRPARGVVLPRVQQSFGEHYTAARTVPVTVVPFGGAGEVRLAVAPWGSDEAKHPSFLDDEGEPLPFGPLAAQADVALPDVEGPLAVLAQLRDARDPEFVFVSDPFEARVVRDASPPEVRRVSSSGANVVDGVAWVSSRDPLLVEIEVFDRHSALASYAVEQPASGEASDPETLSFSSVDAPAGLARVSGTVAPSAGTGPRPVWVHVKDRAGNVAAPALFALGVDDTPPEATLAINAGADWTLGADVLLDLEVASDGAPVTGLRVSDTPVFSGPRLPVLTPLPWALAGRDVEGEKSVYVELVDAAGNVNVVSDTIRLDLRDPQGSVVLEGGSEFARARGVRATLTGEAGTVVAVAAGQVACDATGLVYQAFAGSETRTVTLPDEQGRQVVTACFRDAAGRTTRAQDDVTLDTKAPEPGAIPIVINPVASRPDGAEATAGEVVTLRLSAREAAWVKLAVLERPAVNGACAAATAPAAGLFDDVVAQPFQPAVTFVLPPNEAASNSEPAPADECKTVYASFLDAAGNATPASAALSDTIVLDTLRPDAPRIGTPSGTVEGETFAIELAVPAADHHLAGYELRTGVAAAWTRTEATGCDTGRCRFEVALAPNAENRIGVRASDLAGNPSAEDFIVVTEDSVRPGKVARLDAEAGRGTVTVRWSPPEGATDVQGYELFYGAVGELDPAAYRGTAAREGESPIDVGRVLSATLSGLPLANQVWVGVRAYDAIGPGAFERFAIPQHPDVVSPRVTAVVPAPSKRAGRAVHVKGGYAYVAWSCRAPDGCDGGELSVYELTNPFEPKLAGSIACDLRHATDLARLGTTLYVANGRRISIVDVTRPDQPKCLTPVTLPAHASGADWAMSVAVAGAMPAPPSPQYGHYVWGHGARLYVAAERLGIVVYDLTNPLAPALVGQQDPGGVFSGGSHADQGAGVVRVQGRHLFATQRHYDTNTTKFGMWDVADGTLRLARSFESLPCWGVAPAGTSAYCARNGSIVEFPSYAERQAGSTTVNAQVGVTPSATRVGQPRVVEVAGPYAYVLENDDAASELLVYERRGSRFELAGRSTLTGQPFDHPTICATWGGSSCARPDSMLMEPGRLAVEGLLAVEANPKLGLVVRRIAGARSPTPVAKATVEGGSGWGPGDVLRASSTGQWSTGAGLGLVGHHLALMRDGVLGFVHLGQMVRGEVNFFARAVEPFAAGHGTIVVDGDMVHAANPQYVASWRLGSLSHSQALTPEQAFAVPLANVQALAASWPYLYALTSSTPQDTRGARVHTIDLRTGAVVGASSVLSTGQYFNYPTLVATHGMLYATASDDAVHVLSANRGTTGVATKVGELAQPYASALVANGALLWAGSFDRLQAYSLADPGSPEQVAAPDGWTGVPMGGASLAASGDLLFLGREPGVGIVDASVPGAPALLSRAGDTVYEISTMVAGKHVVQMDRRDLQVIELQ